MNPSRRCLGAMALLSTLALVGMGCGSGATQTFTGPADEVRAATVGNLGKVLVDGQGFTLYILASDRGSGHSTCSGTCADEWPPMTLSPGNAAPIAGPGIKPWLLGLTTGAGGGEQVTYNGWPLYRWPNDSEPGMATGQGVQDESGSWYVLSPAGDVVR